jgi:hypothetical protein
MKDHPVLHKKHCQALVNRGYQKVGFQRSIGVLREGARDDPSAMPSASTATAAKVNACCILLGPTFDLLRYRALLDILSCTPFGKRKVLPAKSSSKLYRCCCSASRRYTVQQHLENVKKMFRCSNLCASCCNTYLAELSCNSLQ